MERIKQIRGAIFDLDGTLLDSMNIWKKIDCEFLRIRGIEMPNDYVEIINPMSFFDAAVYTINRFDLKENPNDLVNEWHERSINAYANDVKLKPDVSEYLHLLIKRGVKLGVATALDSKLFEPVLKNNGIFNLFDSFTTLNEVERGKGFPDVYLSTAKKLGLNPGECAVFEDIYLGIKGANAGGFVTVGIYDEFSKLEEEKIIDDSDYYYFNYLCAIKDLMN